MLNLRGVSISRFFLSNAWDDFGAPNRFPFGEVLLKKGSLEMVEKPMVPHLRQIGSWNQPSSGYKPAIFEVQPAIFGVHHLVDRLAAETSLSTYHCCSNVPKKYFPEIASPQHCWRWTPGLTKPTIVVNGVRKPYKWPKISKLNPWHTL